MVHPKEKRGRKSRLQSKGEAQEAERPPARVDRRASPAGFMQGSSAAAMGVGEILDRSFDSFASISGSSS